MQLNQFPQPMDTIFASGAGASYISPIPVASQASIGRASYTDGFPPLNFLPTSGGGIPVDGRDMNGILYAISALTNWYCAGGAVSWSQQQATALGGYPKWCIVQSEAVFPGVLWVSLVDNNAVNPDTGTPSAPATGWTTFIEWMILAATGNGTPFGVGGPGYQNSWVDGGTISGTLYAPCYFYKDLLGFVHVQGTCKNGSPVASTVIQLPSGKGLYPFATGATAGAFIFMGVSNNATGAWEVTTGGQINITFGSALGFSFGGNTYYANPSS